MEEEKKQSQAPMKIANPTKITKIEKNEPVYENISEVQKALERDLEAQQELQNLIEKLNDQFETSSVASQHLEVSIKDMRMLKSFAQPPAMIKQVLGVAILCLSLSKKEPTWGECLK